MDVDLDQRRGLTGCAGRARDAEPLQLDQADDAFLRGLQPAKQMVERRGADCSTFMILDRDVLIER